MTEHSREDALLTAAAYGPTIFPVLFAAIVGRMLKALATWELQKGTTIGRVEQLVGSHTLVGSLITQIELRTFNTIALSIVVLWALSPVGSQASLRIAYIKSVPIDAQNQLTFMSPDSCYVEGETGDSDNRALVSSLFATSLLSAKVRYGKTQDTWGGLRIPMVEAFDNYTNGDWISIPANVTNITFSSLVGIPFSPILSTGSTSFTLNTSYMTLDCPVFTTKPTNGTFKPTNFTDPKVAPPLQGEHNSWYSSVKTISTGSIGFNSFQIAISSCPSGCAPFMTVEEVRKPREARRIIWESASGDGTGHVDCTLQTSYVDVNYTCNMPSECAATGVRLSQAQHEPSYFADVYYPVPDKQDLWVYRNYTGLDRCGATSALSVIKSLTDDFKLTNSRAVDPVIGFMSEPNSSFTTSYDPDWPGVLSIGRKQFETRFAQLLNTQFIVGISPQVSLGAVAADFGQHANSSLPDFQRFNLLDTTATTTTIQQIFFCDKGWFAAILAISSIVLLAAVASAILRHFTLIPDVLGTLSIATLDNRCENLAKGGSMLDGLERARLLKQVGIRLGDVEPSLPAGRLALAAPLQDMPVGQVERWRMYE
ncbi:hypothetical protein Hte_003692 [Hypoxylon texense]